MILAEAGLAATALRRWRVAGGLGRYVLLVSKVRVRVGALWPPPTILARSPGAGYGRIEKEAKR